MDKAYMQFAAIRKQIKDLEDQESILKTKVVKLLHDEPEGKLVSDIGTFNLCTKKKYTYSKSVIKMEEDLKIKKYDEQQNGKAKVEESQYVTFKE